MYEELSAKDIDKARAVYKAALEIIPHRKFSFAKLWIMFAHFELRRLDVNAARKIMASAFITATIYLYVRIQGYALGKCSPKKKLFRAYIAMETHLREFDRCRKLYEKFLVAFDTSSLVWCEFSGLESQLGEVDRARAILELGVQQEDLDIPEVCYRFESNIADINKLKVLWKAFIDFEIEQGEYDRVRQLYKILLERTNHIKVRYFCILLA